MKGSSTFAFRCEDCHEITQSVLDEALYSCANCEIKFTRAHSADGQNWYCPECNRPGKRVSAKCCKACGSGIPVPVEAMACIECGKLLLETEMERHNIICVLPKLSLKPTTEPIAQVVAVVDVAHQTAPLEAPVEPTTPPVQTVPQIFTAEDFPLPPFLEERRQSREGPKQSPESDQPLAPAEPLPSVRDGWKHAVVGFHPELQRPSLLSRFAQWAFPERRLFAFTTTHSTLEGTANECHKSDALDVNALRMPSLPSAETGVTRMGVQRTVARVIGQSGGRDRKSVV